MLAIFHLFHVDWIAPETSPSAYSVIAHILVHQPLAQLVNLGIAEKWFWFTFGSKWRVFGNL